MKLRLAALIAIAMPVAIYAHLAAAQDNAAPSATPTKPVAAPAPELEGAKAQENRDGGAEPIQDRGGILAASRR